MKSKTQKMKAYARSKKLTSIMQNQRRRYKGETNTINKLWKYEENLKRYNPQKAISK